MPKVKAKAKAKPRGRPSGYSDEIAHEICEELAKGRSLLSICAEQGKPSQSMVYRWLEDRAEFREKYVRARERQADNFADSVHQIAQFEEDTARARLRIDAIKWHTEKLHPRVYGPRQHHTLAGDEDAPIKVETTEINDLELAREVAFFLRKATDK